MEKQHKTRQKDLFRGYEDKKLIEEIKRKNDKITKTSKGKTRSLLGYIRAVNKSKQREKYKDEREAEENGGTEHWRTFRR